MGAGQSQRLLASMGCEHEKEWLEHPGVPARRLAAWGVLGAPRLHYTLATGLKARLSIWRGRVLYAPRHGAELTHSVSPAPALSAGRRSRALTDFLA